MKERVEIKLSELSPGMVVARSVWAPKGNLLIAVDKRITAAMIKRLKKHNISSVFVYVEGSESEILKIALKNNSFKSLIMSEKPQSVIYKAADFKKTDDINIHNTFYMQINNLLDKSARELFKPEVNIEPIKHIVLQTLKSKEIIRLLIYMRVKAQYLLIHSIEVALLCTVIGLESDMPDKRLRNLVLAALLHDIGMTQIKDEVVFKTEPLDSEEIELLRTHAAMSVLVLKDIAKLEREVLEIIYQHHERVNGSGYPSGLTDNVINSSAKILSACDVYSAISHERSYRGKLHPQEKIEFLFASGDHYFSYDIVKMLLNKISIYYKGQWVKLNTGHVGIISGVDPEFPTRPYIKLVYDEKGTPLPFEREVFLGDRGLVRVFIEKII